MLAPFECGIQDGSTYGDWRMPNIREFLSLIDYGNNYPALPDGQPFSYTTSERYWTATSKDFDDTDAWTITLAQGMVYTDDKTLSRRNTCVRGGHKDHRFTINGDGTVTDNMSGLVWLQDAFCLDGMSWEVAMSIAALLDSDTDPCGLTDGSTAGDWRLPTKEEWELFVCTDYVDPAVCNTVGNEQWSRGDPFFIGYTEGLFWSSTYIGGYYPEAWALYLYDGTTVEWFELSGLGIWPVRDP